METSSIGVKCGTMTVMFDTSAGGAGNLAQRLTRDLEVTLDKPRLHRHAPSVSRTTKYFFLPTPSIRLTPLMLL